MPTEYEPCKTRRWVENAKMLGLVIEERSYMPKSALREFRISCNGESWETFDPTSWLNGYEAGLRFMQQGAKAERTIG